LAFLLQNFKIKKAYALTRVGLGRHVWGCENKRQKTPEARKKRLEAVG
jgi:hypothetical protein